MAFIVAGFNKVGLVLLLLLLHTDVLLAQRITVVSSTIRQWSGGIAGRRGANYTFEIAFTGYPTPPIPDTLWIGQTPIRLTLAEPKKQGTLPANTSATRVKNGVTYRIVAGTSNNDYDDLVPDPNKQADTKPSCPVKSNGVAVLAYSFKGKTNYFIINKIKTTLEPINYP